MRDPYEGLGPAAVRVLDRAWGWTQRLSGLAFTILLLAFTVLRTGITAGASEATLLTVRNFPEPIADYRANSVISPAVGHLFGIEGAQGWMLLHLAVIGIGIGIVAWCLADGFSTRSGARIAAIWLALSAVAPSVFKKIGSYDPWTVVGVALMVLPRRRQRALAVVGGLIVGLSNAEQGLVGLACAGAVTVALPRPDDGAWSIRTQLVRLGWAAAGVVTSRAVVLLWWAHIGASVPSRAAVFGEYLAGGLHRAGGAGLSGVFSWFGVAWLVVAFATLLAARTGSMTAGRWIVAGTGLIGVPALATITTLDGTRVFAMVSLPALLVVLRWVDSMATTEHAVTTVQRVTTAGLLAAVVLPALVTDTGGGLWFMLPWSGAGT